MSPELLNDEVRAALTAGNLVHLVTLAPDGSPQVSIVWVGLEDDEIVAGHLDPDRSCAMSAAILASPSPWSPEGGTRTAWITISSSMGGLG